MMMSMKIIMMMMMMMMMISLFLSLGESFGESLGERQDGGGVDHARGRCIFSFPWGCYPVGKSLPIDQTLGLPGPKNCQDNHLLNPFL